MSNLIESLRAELALNLAQDATRSRAGKNDTPLKAQARAMAKTLVKESDATGTPADRVKRLGQSGKLAQLWTTRHAALGAMESCLDANGVIIPGMEEQHETAEAEAEATRAQLATLYASLERAESSREVTPEARAYAARTGRLKELWALRSDAKRRIAKCQDKEGKVIAGMEDERAMALADSENYRLEISTIYGMPIEPYDLETGGRFMRSIRYHITVTSGSVQQGRKVGMLAMDDEDILMRGIELCYLEPARLVETVRFATDGTRIVTMLPTIGDLYRKIKSAHGAEVNRFREALRGRIAFTSLDELLEAGVEPGTLGDDSYFDHYGYGYVDTDEVPWAELKAIAELPVDMRSALAESRRREIKALERAESAKRRATAVRLATVADSGMPLGLSASAKQRERTYRTVLKMVVAGMSIRAVATELGVTPKTVTDNLMALTVKPSGLGYAAA